MSFTRLYVTEFYRSKSTIIEIYVTEYHFSESETNVRIQFSLVLFHIFFATSTYLQFKNIESLY